jgi:hypothetical protein
MPEGLKTFQLFEKHPYCRLLGAKLLVYGAVKFLACPASMTSPAL